MSNAIFTTFSNIFLPYLKNQGDPIWKKPAHSEHQSDDENSFLRWTGDRVERHDFWSRFLPIHSPFLLPSFFWREKKKNNHKSCLSAISEPAWSLRFHNVILHLFRHPGYKKGSLDLSGECGISGKPFSEKKVL